MEDSCKAKGGHRQPQALAIKYPAWFLQPKSQGQHTHLSTRSLLKHKFFFTQFFHIAAAVRSMACREFQGFRNTFWVLGISKQSKEEHRGPCQL